MATSTTKRPRNNPRGTRIAAGDLTGREKLKADKDRRERDLEDAARNSIEQENELYEDATGIFDGQTGERLDQPRPSTVLEVDEDGDEDDDVLTLGSSGPSERAEVFTPRAERAPRIEEPVFTGRENEEDVLKAETAYEIKKRNQRLVDPVQVLRNPVVNVRIAEDVEQMTYGMHNGEPNNFNFKAGRVYRVSVELAEHLDQLGLVQQWV